jgi:hypothetical protein
MFNLHANSRSMTHARALIAFSEMPLLTMARPRRQCEFN